jgi:hypothetical protein
MKTFWYGLNGKDPQHPKKIGKLIPLYPVEIMKVGDWFYVPADRGTMPKAVQSACHQLARRHGMKISAVRFDLGTRVTRVA